jgi:ectoine hydroxylase-related dioxygenase (phytanoyl-CoA dioxygenase family)
MYIKGHTLIKLINDNWVLDITECVGYYVVTNNLDIDSSQDKIQTIIKAFEIRIAENDIIIDKFIDVPLRILIEAREQVEKELKESEILQI